MADVKPIRRLMIANRGEIARRIIRTAHRMGIATVAVYADGDADAPFVREADTAIALRGRTASETYLDAAKLLAACARGGADAIHPGYGFLSENADFATTVIAAGLTWVGPSADSIRRIGNKLAAKILMQTVGVPTLPARELAPGIDPTAVAAQIGYPILVKAAAGGGGRGMRIVTDPKDLVPAIDSARREASAAFADGTIFLESYLPDARHIEIQVLGDRHGNLVHLFERECSIQRRHQKIIEEAPSPAVDATLRARLGAAALSAARSIGYQSAGTVEFLLSGSDFFFLEVNTRLQVEHPVTEAITGLDLVREQLRIAEGEPLGYDQADIHINGHAIEARLCAEDPSQDFLPSPGRVDIWQPAHGPGIRIDSGVETGSDIGTEFDPMIAKLIAHAPTRREAASLLARSLEQTRIQGLTHNRGFLSAILRSAAFLSGETTTAFLATTPLSARRQVEQAELRAACIAASLHARAMRRMSSKVLKSIPGGCRNTPMPPETVGYRIEGQEHQLAYRANRDTTFDITFDGAECHAAVVSATSDQLDCVIDAQRWTFAITSVGDRRLLHGPFGDLELVELPRFPPPGRAEFAGGLRAPMPGRVLAVQVRSGQAVARGDLLIVLEAMKMEHRITAPRDGVVTAMKVTVGDQVANGALLITIESTES